MRRLMVAVMVVLALGILAGSALAESGGYIPPIRVTSWSVGR
ncbi:MAG: hypothetical protein ACOY93_04570 [Bacillota bacterium]